MSDGVPAACTARRTCQGPQLPRSCQCTSISPCGHAGCQGEGILKRNAPFLNAVQPICYANAVRCIACRRHFSAAPRVCNGSRPWASRRLCSRGGRHILQEQKSAHGSPPQKETRRKTLNLVYFWAKSHLIKFDCVCCVVLIAYCGEPLR